MKVEIKHRGKLHCVFGTGKHIWTAGENNVREWNAGTAENVRTWKADLAAPGGTITTITLVSGRLWCGRTDGALSVFDMHTGSAVAHLRILPDVIGAMMQIGNHVWVTTASNNVAVLGVDGTTKLKFQLPKPPRSMATLQDFRGHSITEMGDDIWFCIDGSIAVVNGAIPNGVLNEEFVADESNVKYLDLILPTGKTAGPGVKDHVSCIVGAEPTPIQLEEVGDDLRKQVWCAHTCGPSPGHDTGAGSVAIYEGDSHELVTHITAAKGIQKGVMKMIQVCQFSLFYFMHWVLL